MYRYTNDRSGFQMGPGDGSPQTNTLHRDPNGECMRVGRESVVRLFPLI